MKYDDRDFSFFQVFLDKNLRRRISAFIKNGDEHASYGNLEIIKFNQDILSFSRNAIYLAVINNHYDVVKYLCENRQEGFFPNVLIYTIKSGKLKMFKLLYSHVKLMKTKFESFEVCSPYLNTGADLLDFAIFYNKLDIVKYIYYQKISQNEKMNLKSNIYTALKHGRIKVVDLFYSNHSHLFEGDELDVAASYGQYKLLKFLYFKNIGRCTKYAMSTAAERGYYKIVKFLFFKCNVECYEDTISNTAAKGHYKIVKFLCRNFPQLLTYSASLYAKVNGHERVSEYLEKEFIRSGCVEF